MEHPTNASEVWCLLGVVNEMSKFIPNTAEIYLLLRELLVKCNQWVWSDPQQSTLEEIKKHLSFRPILALYNPNNKTIISTDASCHGLGAVLLQQPDGEVKPVAFVSRSMTNIEVNMLKSRRKC